MRLACMVLAGCAASPAAAPPTASPQPATPAGPSQGELAAREQARRSELSAAHRAKLDEQSTALAATCTKPKSEPVEQRCQPSCYVPEPPDPRAGTKSARPVEITHVVCERNGSYVLADELGTVAVRPVRGRFPKSNKKGTWQADVESAVALALQPDIVRGDVVRVTGTWTSRTHPITRASLRCTTVAHYARSLRKPLDACGSQGAIACEASHNDAVHGLNVVHYRLLEARRLEADGKSNECQQAALEAIAVARGMPRWRQYMSLNTDQWKPVARYRTRFDGVVDEDTLFATAIALGTEAEAVYVACGGAPNPKTTVEHEQSFHTCW